MLPGIAALLFAALPAAGPGVALALSEPAPARAQLMPGESKVMPAQPAGNIISVTYFSSVDGAELHYHEYLPSGYSPTVPYRLVLLLPSIFGYIGQYVEEPPWQAAADARAYILITVEPRSLPGAPANRATFYVDGPLAPGEQDVLDALPSEKARHTIDPNRIYIAGYSMGGIGALNIASQMPGLFAAAAPGAPISDPFQEWSYSYGFPNYDQLFGGVPGASAATDSQWYEYGPRFLLPNLMHTPVQFVHGVSDTTIPNAVAVFPYMQSRHIVDTPGFTDTRGAATTLQQLGSAWPGAYYEEHQWPHAEHGEGVNYWIPADILNFFDAHVLVTNPLTVAFTTYDDRHTRAYWLQMHLVQPLSAKPSLVYATREPISNRAALLVTGSLTLTLDIEEMGLSSNMPLTLSVAPLAVSGAAGDLAVILSGTWPSAAYTIRKDGGLLPPSAFVVLPNHMTLLRQPTDITHTYVFLPPTLSLRVYLPMTRR